MSYSQLGYSGYPSSATVSATSPLTSSQLLVPGCTSLSSSLPAPSAAAPPGPPTPTSSACDSTARAAAAAAMSDPSGATQSVYSSSLLSYPRLSDTVYGSAYAAQGYVPFGADPSAFYAPLGGDTTEAWRNLSQTTAWPYDPNGMAGYPYSTGYGGLDVRRKNATRESTATLKAWLYEHIKNPYPTKGEKIMLAIITKMTLTQVSTWFANARRRLKKENKMTWSPRNRCDEDGDDEDGNSDDENNEHNKKEHEDDDVLDDSEFINVDCDKDDEEEEAERAKRDRISSTSESEDVSRPEVQSATSCKSPPSGSCHNGCPSPHGSNCSSPNTTSPGLPPRIPLHPGLPIRPLGLPATTALNYSHLKNNASIGTSSASSSLSSPSQTSSATTRPKIWSIADVATSSDNHSDRKSPTAPSGPPQQLQPSHAGPIRPQHIGAHSGLGLGRSWAAAAVAANGLSHPYSLAPHFLGLHRDPTASVGSFISGPNTSAILSRFGFPPMAMSTSSLADPKRLAGGAPVAAPANR